MEVELGIPTIVDLGTGMVSAGMITGDERGIRALGIGDFEVLNRQDRP